MEIKWPLCWFTVLVLTASVILFMPLAPFGEEADPFKKSIEHYDIRDASFVQAIRALSWSAGIEIFVECLSESLSTPRHGGNAEVPVTLSARSKTLGEVLQEILDFEREHNGTAYFARRSGVVINVIPEAVRDSPAYP